jgi:ATP/maltotriose-dependent transcriptional regulator MalT
MGERLFRVVPFVHVADFTFYRGLAAAALAAELPRRRGARYRRAVGRCRKLLRRWARNGPDFAHMATLLEAELARLRGRPGVARSAFERAARQAREHQFLHHAALAHERRASLLTALRRETEASSALEEAAALYAEWGASSKVAQLEQRSTRGD